MGKIVNIKRPLKVVTHGETTYMYNHSGSKVEGGDERSTKMKVQVPPGERIQISSTDRLRVRKRLSALNLSQGSADSFRAGSNTGALGLQVPEVRCLGGGRV